MVPDLECWLSWASMLSRKLDAGGGDQLRFLKEIQTKNITKLYLTFSRNSVEMWFYLWLLQIFVSIFVLTNSSIFSIFLKKVTIFGTN